MNHAENNLVHSWSHSRNEESYAYKPFMEQPVLKLSHWTSAWQWSSRNKEIIKYKHDNSTYYCISAGIDTKLSKRDCSKYFNIVDQTSWANFDEYSSHINKIRFIKFNKNDWLKSQCSCSYWAKNYFCNHVIGLAVIKKQVVFKDIHKVIPIGQTRPRGQPKKTKGALEKQQDYSSSSSSEDSSVVSEESPKKVVSKKGYQKKLFPKKRGRKPKSQK